MGRDGWSHGAGVWAGANIIDSQGARVAGHGVALGIIGQGIRGRASGRQGDGVAALPAAVALAVVPLGRWAVGRGGHEDSPCAAVALTDS